MLGMADPWITAAWLLNVGAMVLCVVYGVLHWNKGGEE